jgi:hypothetical protein
LGRSSRASRGGEGEAAEDGASTRALAAAAEVRAQRRALGGTPRRTETRGAAEADETAVEANIVDDAAPIANGANPEARAGSSGVDERSALDVRALAAGDGRDSERAVRTRGVRGESVVAPHLSSTWQINVSAGDLACGVCRFESHFELEKKNGFFGTVSRFFDDALPPRPSLPLPRPVSPRGDAAHDPLVRHREPQLERPRGRRFVCRTEVVPLLRR